MTTTKKSKYVAPVTYADHLAAERSYFQSMKSEAFVPEVNYFYKVGERVSLGSLEESIVEEVFDGGKKIHISYHDIGSRYGQPYDAGRKPRIVWWNELDPIDTIQPTKFARPRLRTQYTQQGLDGLVNTLYHRGFIDSPEYQRGYVWTLEDKQRLVRSIFNRADVGKFVLLEHPYPENRLEIVDGKQRLGAIREFIEGRFAFEGFVWNQLSWEDKQSFFDIMVQVCTLQAEHVKKSDILWLFLTINAAGVPQTEEHIKVAQAMYDKAIEEGK